MTDRSLFIRRAGPASDCRALFREQVEDFRVDEELGFEPDGSGEHVYLQLRKRDQNSDEVARLIARAAGVRPMDIGYSGMKDRRAVASQWFSIYLANRPEPDWQRLQAEGLQLLRVSRHRQKLRRGQHIGNCFEIRLRQLQGDRARLETALVSVRDQGFPNAFGEQRFGIRGANLDRAENLFRGELRQRDRHKRGIYLSAARSWLFNQVLARRIEQGTWCRIIGGDLTAEVPRQSWSDTLAVPTGPLYGDAPLQTVDAAGAVEADIAAANPLFIEGLKSQRIQPERRPLVAFPIGLTWDFEGDDLILRFALTSGSFATALLNECLELETRWFQETRETPVSAQEDDEP